MLDFVSAWRVDELIGARLEDPTTQNPQVRRLSEEEFDAVFQIGGNGVNAYDRLVNALVAEVIAVVPLTLNPD